MGERASAVASRARFVLALILSLAVTAEAVAGSECDPIARQITSYEERIKPVLQDEPEDLPKDLARYARLIESGETDRARPIGEDIRSSYVGMEAITAPKELTRIHTDLVTYYRDGVAALDASDARDRAAYRKAEIDTWLGLKRYFVNLRDLWVEYACLPGEVEAIEEQHLPRLEEYLADLRKGQAAPRVY